MHRSTTALTAAALSLLPIGQPLLLGTLGIATATSAVVLHQGAAIAQDASAVARIAKAITVRIEGATQGSGVLVDSKNGSYQVITAWHVIKSNAKGEKIDIYTSDGFRHTSSPNSFEKIKGVDLGTFTFKKKNNYSIAKSGMPSESRDGANVFVSGYPLATSSVPKRIRRFSTGEIIANTTEDIPKGYQMLYNNLTYPGMSGGAVLNIKGELVAIHGRAETVAELNRELGYAVKSGTNQGVPITHYKTELKTIVISKTWWNMFLDFIGSIFWKEKLEKKNNSEKDQEEVSMLLARGLSLEREQGPSRAGANAYHFVEFNGNEREIIDIANRILEKDAKNYTAYMLRAKATKNLQHGTCEETAKMRGFVNLQIWWKNCKYDEARYQREEEQRQLALFDYKAAEALEPEKRSPLLMQYNIFSRDGMKGLALATIQKALALSPDDEYMLKAKAAITSSCDDLMRALEASSLTPPLSINPLYKRRKCFDRINPKLSTRRAEKAINRINKLMSSNKLLFENFTESGDNYPVGAFKDRGIYSCSSYPHLSGSDICTQINKGSDEYQAGLAYFRYTGLLKLRGVLKTYSGKIESGCGDISKVYKSSVDHNYYPKSYLSWWSSDDVCKPSIDLHKSYLIRTDREKYGTF